MEIRDLSKDQQVALAALVEAVAIADGEVSAGEEGEIGALVEALGEENYRRLLDEAESRYPNQASLKRFLGAIKDKEVQELMFQAVMEEATGEASIVHAQSDLLDWLAETWKIPIEVEGEESV